VRVSSAGTRNAPGLTQRLALGVPVGLSKDVILPGELGDAGWNVLVSVLRATFNAHGKEIGTGVVREWRNGRLRVAVEPTPAGHRLRMSTQKGGALRGPIIGSLSSTIYAASLVAASTAKPALLMLAAVPAGLGVLFAAWPFLTLPKWARARSAQFDAIAREAAALTTQRVPLAASHAPPAINAS